MSVLWITFVPNFKNRTFSSLRNSLKNSIMVDTLINKLASISMTIYVQLEKKIVIFFPKVLFILPRHSSQYATARVKLAKHRVEPQDNLTFYLAKRKKVTLYLKVITQCFDFGFFGADQ